MLFLYFLTTAFIFLLASKNNSREHTLCMLRSLRIPLAFMLWLCLSCVPVSCPPYDVVTCLQGHIFRHYTCCPMCSIFIPCLPSCLHCLVFSLYFPTLYPSNFTVLGIDYKKVSDLKFMLTYTLDPQSDTKQLMSGDGRSDNE